MSLSLQLRTPLPRMSVQSTPLQRPICRLLPFRSLSISRNFSINRFRTAKAVEESKERAESETEGLDPAATDEVNESKVELRELGAEIKKAMQERKEAAEGNFFSGVTEEIGEIEWPAFGKALGITGVVLGVIAGSSVVLLTLNAVLAELSDRVFSGRGVQDFFG